MAPRLRVSAPPPSLLEKMQGCFERVTAENPGEFQLPLFIRDEGCEHVVNYVRGPAGDLHGFAALIGADAEEQITVFHARTQTSTRARAGLKVTDDLKPVRPDN